MLAFTSQQKIKNMEENVKKLLYGILVLALIVPVAFFATACGNSETEPDTTLRPEPRATTEANLLGWWLLSTSEMRVGGELYFSADFSDEGMYPVLFEFMHGGVLVMHMGYSDGSGTYDMDAIIMSFAVSNCGKFISIWEEGEDGIVLWALALSNNGNTLVLTTQRLDWFEDEDNAGEGEFAIGTITDTFTRI